VKGEVREGDGEKMRRSASLHPILRNERDGWGARIVVVRCCKPPKLILATLPGCDQDLAIAVVQLAYFHRNSLLASGNRNRNSWEVD
ncbi:MAG: hypothetical protein WBQ06_09365, partial [Acidobacteriaceae bacterium]